MTNRINSTEKYLYKEIENYIKDGINAGKFPQDSLLPTEKELCELFGCSRMTVNKALNNIADNGLIERVRGSGSFVRLPNMERNTTAMSSFTEQQRQKGVTVSTKLLAYSMATAKSFPQLPLAKNLCIKPSDMVYHFLRLRYANGKPAALQDTYVPVSRIPTLDISSLDKSFYEYVEKKLHLVIQNGKSFLKGTYPDATIAKYLGISTDQAVIFVRHVSCLNTGLPFEFVDTYTICENYSMVFYNKRGL